MTSRRSTPETVHFLLEPLDTNLGRRSALGVLRDLALLIKIPE